MKKVIFLFMVSLFSLAAIAQSTVYIYKTDGSAIPYTIATVDSISFNAAQDSVYINQTGGTHSPYQVATIDSISFTHPGVLINGVYWASRNVATAGTFTTNAEDAGYFYQWNSNVGWPATGAIGSITATDGTTTWNSSWNGGFTTTSATDTWATANDPSPAGYRVPTLAEIQTLLDATKVTTEWTTQSGVYGKKITDITTGNSIFLTASGNRSGNDGTLSGAGSPGYYWSSETDNASTASSLFFSSSYAYWLNDNRTNGFTVRPVAE